jgi:acetoin:2,6-dichlorophenolindophenol oxidoreductase subunit beta
MKTVLDSINSGLHRSMEADPCVYMIGEDILDPYGGAFKATRGISSKYPERVWTAPISEGGMVGVAAGMALRGLRPVVEIMFGDFLTLAADQLINHAAKFRWMYNDQVKVPLVIRTPMGGRRGYGPTHSQSLEKFFLGTPGLSVIAPGPFAVDGIDPGKFLESAILETEDPILFIENKLLYLLPVRYPEDMPEFEVSYSHGEESPNSKGGVFSLKIRGAPPPGLTITAYGYMAELARQAVLELAYAHEVFAELVSPVQISPFQLSAVFKSVNQTGRLLAVEEGSLSMGWGAEVLARTAESSGVKLNIARRLTAKETPIASSGPLEEEILPGIEDIIATALAMIKR